MRQQRQPKRQGAREAVIVFTVGGFKFAIAANAVREVRGLEGLQPRPSSGAAPIRVPKVGFTLERNGTVHFVVDGAKHFHLLPSKAARVLVLRNEPVAVLTDNTDRIMEISTLHELPLAFTGDERNWYRGLAIMNGDVVPVVNHNSFLSRSEQAVLKSALQAPAPEKRRAIAV
ncbi:MAG TPA: chemotaxis protein CheW [Candidatus Angelobacter sp.]|nr:chemotaxis protein CheW [Candidatus Angelobacter sp.]